MRKIILMMLLAVISNSAMAEWTKVGSNENTVAYADLATTLSMGNRVKMWSLYDYSAAQKTSVAGESFLSARMQYEYDCKEKKMRILDLTSHSKNMGEGKVIFKMYDPQDWKPFLPNNVQEVLWKVACKAVEWYQKAAAQGHADAQYNLGLMYDNGEGVLKDAAKAAKWYQKAAAQGHGKAQISLGWSYVNGDGVPKDAAKAMEWWLKAASQGHANANTQYQIGLMYRHGEGVPKNAAKAVEWYQKAAAQGHAQAQDLLGIMYDKGEH